MPRHWTGTPLNCCTGCGHDFASTTLFGRHRIGDYAPGEFNGNLADWTPEVGRRCSASLRQGRLRA